MFVIGNMIQQISVIRVLIFMFHLRYIGHMVYRLSTHTSVTVQKRIQRRKPTRGGSVWTQVQQIFFNTSSTTDVLTTCGFSGFGSI